MRGGLGVVGAAVDDATVVALAVVNAVGDVVADDGSVVAGSTAPPGSVAFPTTAPFEEGNTTLVAVVTDGRADKADCHLLAQSAHDGFAHGVLERVETHLNRRFDRGCGRRVLSRGDHTGQLLRKKR